MYKVKDSVKIKGYIQIWTCKILTRFWLICWESNHFWYVLVKAIPKHREQTFQGTKATAHQPRLCMKCKQMPLKSQALYWRRRNEVGTSILLFPSLCVSDWLLGSKFWLASNMRCLFSSLLSLFYIKTCQSGYYLC